MSEHVENPFGLKPGEPLFPPVHRHVFPWSALIEENRRLRRLAEDAIEFIDGEYHTEADKLRKTLEAIQRKENPDDPDP